MKNFIAKFSLNLDDFALHLSRIFGATTFAAGGATSERVMQREGRWESDADKAYTRNIIEDSKRVSRKLVVAREENERQPGEGTAGGTKL